MLEQRAQRGVGGVAIDERRRERRLRIEPDAGEAEPCRAEREEAGELSAAVVAPQGDEARARRAMPRQRQSEARLEEDVGLQRARGEGAPGLGMRADLFDAKRLGEKVSVRIVKGSGGGAALAGVSDRARSVARIGRSVLDPKWRRHRSRLSRFGPAAARNDRAPRALAAEGQAGGQGNAVRRAAPPPQPSPAARERERVGARINSRDVDR